MIPIVASRRIFPEHALIGNQAGIFDHAVHTYPHLQRRLRRRLCCGVGSNSFPPPPHPTIINVSDGDLSCSPASWKLDAPDWAEEAPHVQLNGGSDPVVVTATHVVEHGTSQRREGRCADATLRLRLFNATNARLQGFSIRLSFGQGGEAGGMVSAGGRVETSVNEVRVFRLYLNEAWKILLLYQKSNKRMHRFRRLHSNGALSLYPCLSILGCFYCLFGRGVVQDFFPVDAGVVLHSCLLLTFS